MFQQEWKPDFKTQYWTSWCAIGQQKGAQFKDFFAGQKFLYLKPIKGSPADETVQMH